MELIPYSCQQIDQSDIAAVVAVLQSDYLTQGPAVAAFEKAFASRHHTEHAVAVSNATAALHAGCLALGVGPGKRVWTSPNSFLASANCALYCGAAIDFVDIDPASRNMSVAALASKLASADRAGKLPDVIIPVDFSGLPSDHADIRALADRYGFRILLDASHAAGAEYRGAPVGSRYADITVFSMHAVKIVTTAEGGMLTTQDAALADRLRLLRSHGMTRAPEQMKRAVEGGWYYEQIDLGYNYRLTDLQAALGLSQLTRIETMQAQRNDLADRYDVLLADLPVKRPLRLADRTSAWHLYAIEVGEGIDRGHVFSGMRAAGIGVNVHYIPIHTQPYYEQLGFRRGDFPAAEAYYDRAISIPLFPRMTYAQQDRVAAALRSLLR